MSNTPESPISDDAESELRFIRNRFDEDVIYEVNRGSFDKEGSVSYFDNHFRDTLWQENSFYLIVGSDSGLLYNYVVNRDDLPKGSRYLFIEEDSLLQRIAGVICQDRHQEVVGLCSLATLDAQLQHFAFNSYCVLDSQKIIDSVGVLDGHYAPLLDFKGVVGTHLSSLIFNTKANLSTRVFLKQILLNVAECITPVRMFRGIFKGKTAVLLGRGPSADLAFDWVRENRDRLLVAAASSLSKKLLSEKITPDFVFTVDPQPTSFNVSRELLLMDKNVILFNKTHAEHILTMGFSGRKVYIDNKYPWKVKNEDLNSSGMGPTVINSALSILMEMAFTNIVLAGVDMCYSPDGFSHSRGTKGAYDIPFSGKLDQTVETNAGGIAETDNAFFQMHKALAEQAANAMAQGITIATISPNAAKTPHVLFKHVDEITIHNHPNEIKEIIDNHFLWPTKEELHKKVTHTLTDLKKVQRDITTIEKLCQETLDNINTLFSDKSSGKEKKYTQKINKAESTLNHKYEYIINTIKYFNIEGFLKTITYDEQYQDKDSKLEKSLADYYSAYLHGCKRVKTDIDNAIFITNAVLAEQAEQPDYKLLCEYWDKYALSWRAMAFMQRRNLAIETLEPTYQEAFKRYQQNSHDHLHGKTSYDLWKEETVKKLDLTHVRNRATAHFRNGNRVGLAQIINGIKLLEHKERDEHLSYFSGLLCELDGQFTEALEQYQQITEGYLLEDALRRIAYISTISNDINTLVLALDCLAQISQEYLIQLAKVYLLQGSIEEALEAYTRYLDASPNDIFVLTQLGNLFFQLENHEGAEFIFKHILSLDPQNRTALARLNQA
ncbi:MAG: DUF115 domain-containing protein [Gammaproteobacteria bacterium]|nr:DUF115 domain-containing protein [Gammaproteobacteria bacterium]